MQDSLSRREFNGKLIESPCKNFKVCGNTVTRRINIRSGYTCESCKVDYHRKYSRNNYLKTVDNHKPKKKSGTIKNMTDRRPGMNSSGLGKKVVKAKKKDLNGMTGSDHLFDGQMEHGSGRAVKNAKRLGRKPE